MAIRLVTKTGGRLSARVHSAFFHLAKGNSIKEKPYGIVPTKDYDDPFGLVFDNTELKVRIKPGQFSCYGRQCIITEETEAVRMGDVYLTSDKLYMTVYARIDLNDQVFQKVELRYAYNTEAHVDFPKRQMAQNLYRKTNGLYDVPLARFVFHQNPTTPDGYFTDYEKVIETFDDESRAATKQTERIGSKSKARLLDNGAFVLKADHAEHSKGASLIGNTEISEGLENVWTAKRAPLFLHSAVNFTKGNEINIPLTIDKNHLSGAYLMSDYCKITDARREVCLRFATRVRVPTGGVMPPSSDVLVKLKMNCYVALDYDYYVTVFPKSQIGFNKDGSVFWDLSISSKEPFKTLICLAKFRLSESGFHWEGMFDDSFTIQSGGEYYCVLSAPEIVTADSSGKWFYGNQGKSVYVDFIYKGGVTLI